MIARMWRANTENGTDADRYTDTFRTEVCGELAGIPGCHGAFLLRAARDAGAEFVALTLFDSLDAVRGFAGPDADRANVSAAARAVLSGFDETVRHFTVVVRT